jgi:hypothetical protein
LSVALRISLRVVAGFGALVGCDLGVWMVFLSAPASDIDGPRPWGSRAVGSAVGVTIFVVSAAVLVISIGAVVRMARRPQSV